jgi:hypothetical protein
MSISNLFKPGGLVWRPDANSINAPEGTLLRADNMVPDEDGALSVRRGSRVLYTFPLGTEDVHSLYTYEGSDGYTYRMMGVDDQVYKNPGPGNHTAIWERQYGGEEEKVLNGEFPANLSSWTAGTGWAWETGGYARHTAGNVLPLTQVLNIISGTTYYVEVTFFETTAGTVVVTLGTVTVTGATGTDGTVRVPVVAAATGFVTLAITPVTAFDGAVDSISVKTAEADAVSFQFLTQRNYTGGNWEKAYAATGDVGPVPYSATWEDAYISALVTTLEPVNFNVTFDGSGDIAFGDDHQQSFLARGTTAKKFDGKSFMNWGIAKPSAPATLSAITPESEDVITCATGEPIVTYHPQTGDAEVYCQASFVPDETSVADQATRIIPGRISGYNYCAIKKMFVSDTDFYNLGGNVGSDQDVFDIAVKFDDPKHVRELKMRVDVGSGVGGTVDYAATRYEYIFYPQSPIASLVRDAKNDGANAYDAKIRLSLDPIVPKDRPRVNTPEVVKNQIASVGVDKVPVNTGGVPTADVWMHLAITRGQFYRLGSEVGRDWSTVRQVVLEIVTTDGEFPATTVADWVVYGAGAGTLSGTYQVLYRWVRETDRYYETSPPSDPSEEIELLGNQLRVTIPGATQNAADDQVTSVWVYIYGGFLDTYYRAAVEVADPQLSSALVIDLEKNEIDILTENEKLEPFIDEPQDNIIAIAGPWNGRLFTLTNEGYVYPSLQTSPSTFNTYQVIDLSNQGDPLWMVKTSSGVHCGCERDVVFLAGSGDEDADRVVIDLYPHPLNIGTPPIDSARFVDGNSILYRSTDGLIMLASQGLTHVPDDGMRLLWRGQDRHGVSALNILTGRFRMTVDNKLMFVLASEGATAQEGTQVVYRLNLSGGQWSRLIYPDPLLSIFNDPDGTTIAGTNNGKLLELEYGTGDTAANPSVTIWTPFSDGGNPLVRKDAFDLQLHTDTNANTGTVEVWKDGATAATTSYTFATSQPQAYRIQAEDIGAFIRAQLKITGTFDEFQLSSLDLTYRVRAQHMTYLDTGYFQGDDPSDVIWLQEAELDVNSPSDLSLLVYLDDTLYTTQTVGVTANIRSVYRVPLPRGTKSRRPRIVVKTTASDGAGEIGFDPYFVRVRTRSSGNQAKAGFRTVWPAGQAP